MADGQPLATTDELQARLSYDMEPNEIRVATGALEDLSDDARHYGRATWLTPETAPSAVRNLVLRAASRFMGNYEGYTTSRAGDENLQWTDLHERAGSPYFTSDEQAALKRLAGATGLYSPRVFAYGSSTYVPSNLANRNVRIHADDAVWVPCEDGTEFPMFSKSDFE